ncbi:cyclic-phosphate processing receiver domain-containing protein [Candidatus Uabimicrobium sp. HlEnr_7]|uniref:cyclic-phosphate processing receiver domain-containing protein n=1 Tax=Candidatus Uabimicrobium helgolandensis TaxID=3095367 RepID=UPI003557ACAB
MSNKKILRILFVEDLLERQQKLCDMYKDHAWIVAETAMRAIKLISVYDFDLILLDYNLEEETTGLEVAQFIVKSRNAHTKVVLHSMNPDGAKKMLGVITSAEVIPISKLTKKSMYTKRLNEQLNQEQVNWNYVFNGYC